MSDTIINLLEIDKITLDKYIMCIALNAIPIFNDAFYIDDEDDIQYNICTHNDVFTPAQIATRDMFKSISTSATKDNMYINLTEIIKQLEIKLHNALNDYVIKHKDDKIYNCDDVYEIVYNTVCEVFNTH